MRYMVSLVIAWLLVVSLVCPAASQEPVDIDALRQGLWSVAFVVLPEVPECETALEWLGEIQHSFPKVEFLVLSPWITDEVKATAAQAELPLAVDEDGQLGAILGIDDVPAVLTLREGRVTERVVWPFEREELREAIAALATAPVDGPARHVGEEVLLGTATTLAGEETDLDQYSEPVLISFFNPMCPPCWRGLPALVDLQEEIDVVMVLLDAGALTDAERTELEDTGLTAVLDDDRGLLEALGIRSTPTYLLRDEAGVIRWVGEGVVAPEKLWQAVLDLQNENAPEKDGS